VPAIKFVNASGLPANFVAPTTLGLFASLGIVKGKPFNPNERMKKILSDAANIGAVTARTIGFKIRNREAFFYPNSSWRLPFFGDYKFEVSPGVANLDGAVFFYYIATGVTPAMEAKMVGQGSQYPWTSLDSKGNPFDGCKTYRLRLPPLDLSQIDSQALAERFKHSKRKNIDMAPLRAADPLGRQLS
jgi:hypothetical protein